jgi:formylglycine-generating enzyme required for sulfatase activity
MPRRLLSWLGLLIAFAGLASAQDGPPPPPERVFVLVVGVEDYADPKITDLAYTEDDAQAVYDFFAKSPRSPTIASRVKLLRGKKATRIGVLREIRDHLVRKAVGPGDTAILYFAGHGFADADGTYLAAQDTQLDDLQFSAIAWSELQRVWSKIAAGRRVFLADACHSGGLAGLRGFGGISKGGSLSLKKAPSRASVLIAATGANQLSVEDKRRKHGVFTASLLDGLSGAADTNRDSTVSLGELSAYLKLQVPQLAKQAGGNQSPTVSIRGSEAFAQGLVLSSGKARPKAAGTGELARVKAERLAAEKERESADLRAKLAEARLETLKGASTEELHKAQAEATRLRTEAAKAHQAVERLRAEEAKRIAAEKRAAKAEAEAAELRRELAELKGQKAEAAKAKREAEAARKRERELAGGIDLSEVKAGQVYVYETVAEREGKVIYEKTFNLKVVLVTDKKVRYQWASVTAGRETLEAEAWYPTDAPKTDSRTTSVNIDIGGQSWDCKVTTTTANGKTSQVWVPQKNGIASWPMYVKWVTKNYATKVVSTTTLQKIEGPDPLLTGKSAAPSRGSSGYALALKRANRLKGFTYLDTKSFTCGGKSFQIARFKHAKTGLVFHLVPGGSYLRGSTKGEAREKPVAKVTIQPFLICATECSQAAWRRVTGKAPSRLKGARKPVDQVSWDDAQGFGNKAGLRLPSEAEWEYACRAGSTSAYCFGKIIGALYRYAAYGPGETQDVGSRLPNAFGLFDMHGNVWEWCQDAYVDSYTGAPADGSARGSAGASRRVLRGGSCGYPGSRSRSAYRSRLAPGNRLYNHGFRPAKSLPLGPQGHEAKPDANRTKKKKKKKKKRKMPKAEPGTNTATGKKRKKRKTRPHYETPPDKKRKKGAPCTTCGEARGSADVCPHCGIE